MAPHDFVLRPNRRYFAAVCNDLEVWKFDEYCVFLVNKEGRIFVYNPCSSQQLAVQWALCRFCERNGRRKLRVNSLTLVNNDVLTHVYRKYLMVLASRSSESFVNSNSCPGEQLLIYELE